MNATLLHSTDKGDQVICLHSSMSSSRQWESLMKRLQHSYRVTALDLHGYGHDPELVAGTTCSLDREVEILADIMDEMDGPIHLVGHSYGGAVRHQGSTDLWPANSQPLPCMSLLSSLHFSRFQRTSRQASKSRD